MPTEPTTPERGNVTATARAIGRTRVAVYRYMDQTRGQDPHPLGLIESPTGATLDIEKTRVYAEARRPGRPRGNGQN